MTARLFRGFLTLFLSTAFALTAGQREFIFTHAPFASAHASTIVSLQNGDLLAAWFGGSAEGHPDVAIWMSRRHSGHWSPPAEFAREPRIAAYNPVLFYAGRRLWFYYKFGPSPSTWSAARRFSDDDGQTWSGSEYLPAGLLGPIRAKPLVLSGGVVVSGTSVESYRSWAVWIERSIDSGQTWRKIGPVSSPPHAVGRDDKPAGMIQPSIVALSDRRLRLYARATRQIGHICIADSADAGLTWTPARTLALPNPNSGIDAVRLRDGRIILVYNDSADARTPLSLAVSRDGEHFRNFRTLESGPGEFSYPALIEARDGGLDLTYTWNRQRISYVHLAPSEIPRD